MEGDGIVAFEGRAGGPVHSTFLLRFPIEAAPFALSFEVIIHLPGFV
jgi:hypothetical protein